MLRFQRKIRIDTERMVLRPPAHTDFRPWSDLRRESAEFLQPWEPSWSTDHLTRKGFVNRVYWANRSIAQGTAVPLFLIRREDRRILGAITSGAGLARLAPSGTGLAQVSRAKATCRKP